MKAVVIGPGRIGCGFVGQLLRETGHTVTFVARDPVLVEHFNRTKSYRVRLSKEGTTSEHVVTNITAVAATDTERVAEEMASAEVIATAVGYANLAEVAPIIASGLAFRTNGVNVLAFENGRNVSLHLRELIKQHLPEGFPLWRHGVAGALVTRAVTERWGEPALNDPLVFVGDPYSEFMVDRSGLGPSLASIRGMRLVHNYEAWVQRKLYTFSAGHATTAYLGYLKGYRYIHSAICDPEIRRAVLAAMREGQRGLAKRYGPTLAGDEADLLEIVTRFENAALCDPIERVARDPQRKLGAEERLVGAARLAEAAGLRPETLAMVAAAALYFSSPTDLSARELQRWIETNGPALTLNRISGLDPGCDLGRLVARDWGALSKGWLPGNLLLDMSTLTWAVERIRSGHHVATQSGVAGGR